MRHKRSSFPVSYPQGMGNRETADILLIPNYLKFPDAPTQKTTSGKLKSTPDAAPPFEIRRCYQPADMPLDALVEVLCLLLAETPASGPKTPPSVPPAATCFPAPNE